MRASLLGMLAITLLIGCERPSAPREATPVTPPERVPRVDVAVIDNTSAQLTLQLIGEVEGWRDAMLASSQGGYVESVDVQVGDSVSKGAVLVQVDSQLYTAGLSQAQAQYELASSEAKRFEALGDGISQSAREQALTQSTVTKAALEQAQVRLARSRITAPFDGVITSVDIEPGEVAGVGQPLARLVQLSPAKVSVAVSDRDVVSLTTGMKATVSTDARSTLYPGVIRHISPAANLKSRAFTVDIAVPNPENTLLPGMIARVHVQSEAQQGLVIPQDWVITQHQQQGVFVETEGQVAWRSLQLGAIIHNQVVVQDGLAAGDRVVVVGHRNLIDGDRVLVSRTGRCCTNGRALFKAEEP